MKHLPQGVCLPGVGLPLEAEPWQGYRGNGAVLQGGAADGEVQAWQLADDELRLALHDEVKILREEIREMKANRVA